jgi:4-aminobutyrate aminotransferase
MRPPRRVADFRRNPELPRPRTGSLYACEQLGATPDILVIGKGLGGGIMPLAAILAAQRLDCAPEAALGHCTHEKSPVACAAALATLDVIEEEKLIDRARELGARGLQRLRDMKARHSVIRDVRGLGCYFGVEIGGHDPAGFADHLLYRCLARGLSFKLGAGRVITLCPPLTIPLDEFEAGLAILDEALCELSG